MKMKKQTKIVGYVLLVLPTLFMLVSTAEVKLSTVNIMYNNHAFSNLTIYLEFLDSIFDYLSSGDNITNNCSEDTQILLDKANSGDVNALKILDSTGKPSSGVLEGGVYFIGFYSECINTVVNFDDKNFDGQYCLLNFNFGNGQDKHIPQASWLVLTHSTKPPTIGICIPSSCSVADLQQATNSSMKENFDQISSKVSACHRSPEPLSKDKGAITVLCVFIIFAVIAVSATAVDIYLENKLLFDNSDIINPENLKSVSQELLCKVDSQSPKENFALDLLLAFSFKRNASKIFSVKGGGDNIPCVHGLKFLSMVLIILGHTYSYAVQNLYFRNPGAVNQAPKDFLSQIFANGTFAVDTFYLISGLLVAFVTLKILDKTEGKFPLLFFYLHRYFRLTPVFLAVVMFCAFILRYLGSGPDWLQTIAVYDVWCKENGWLNILYIHNLVHTNHMCLAHTWYLATDMQIYVIVPLFLWLLHRNFKYGVMSMMFFFLISVITTAVITVINNYPAIPYINNLLPLDLVNGYYQNVYIKPYCRIGAYIVGIALGYFLLYNKELILKKTTIVIMWISSVALGITVIYLMWPANQGILPTPAEAAAYSALARPIWAISLSWLIVACFYGYGGIINSILSCRVLVPFSRLTYCAYLIHPVVMNVYYGSTQTEVDFSMNFMMYLFLGNLCITFVISVLLSLLFESPFVALEKVLLYYKTKVILCKRR